MLPCLALFSSIWKCPQTTVLLCFLLLSFFGFVRVSPLFWKCTFGFSRMMCTRYLTQRECQGPHRAEVR